MDNYGEVFAVTIYFHFLCTTKSK